MVCATDEVWPTTVGEPQMLAGMTTGMFSAVTSWATGKVLEKNLRPSVEKIKKDVGKHIGTTIVNGLRPDVQEVVKKTLDLQKYVKERFNQMVSSTLLTDLISQILHVCVNPTIPTLAVSVGTVLVNLFQFGVGSISMFVNGLTEYFSKTFHLFQERVVSNVIPGECGLPEGPGDFIDANKSLIGVLFTALCTLFGVACKGPKGGFDLLRNVNSSFSLINNITTFLKNAGEAIGKLINYIYSKIYPSYDLYAQFSEKTPEIKDWITECLDLLDARNRERLAFDNSMVDRVFYACTTGALLVSTGLDEKKPCGKVVFELYKEMKLLRNTLIEKGAHPDVRFETYPFWIEGPPGVGKSHLVTDLSAAMLDAIGHTQPGGLIYYIPSGAKYWSGCRQPAVLVTDDIFQVGGTRLEEEIANLFLICSCSVLNPPMADVAQKEMRINPLLYIVLTNSGFPELSPTARCEGAIFRRRQFLWKADLTPEMKRKYPNFVDARQISDEDKKDRKHLEFRYALNVKDQSEGYSEAHTYDEMQNLLIEDFKDFYAKERLQFKKRMIQMYRLDPNFNERNLLTEIPALANDGLTLVEKRKVLEARIQAELDEIQYNNIEDGCWEFVDRQREYVKDWYHFLKSECRGKVRKGKVELERMWNDWIGKGKPEMMEPAYDPMSDMMNMPTFNKMFDFFPDDASVMSVPLWDDKVSVKSGVKSLGGEPKDYSPFEYITIESCTNSSVKSAAESLQEKLSGIGMNPGQREEVIREFFKNLRDKEQSELEILHEMHKVPLEDAIEAYENVMELYVKDARDIFKLFWELNLDYKFTYMLPLTALVGENNIDTLDRLFLNQFLMAEFKDTPACSTVSDLMCPFDFTRFEKIRFLMLYSDQREEIMLRFMSCLEFDGEIKGNVFGDLDNWTTEQMTTIFKHSPWPLKGSHNNILANKNYVRIRKHLFGSFLRGLLLKINMMCDKTKLVFSLVTCELEFEKVMYNMYYKLDAFKFMDDPQYAGDNIYMFAIIMSYYAWFESLLLREGEKCSCKGHLMYGHGELDLDYCDVRNKLSVRSTGKTVEICKNKRCPYSQDILYVIGCVYAQAHFSVGQHAYWPASEVPYIDGLVTRTADRDLWTSDSIIRMRKEKHIDKQLSLFSTWKKEATRHWLPNIALWIVWIIDKILPWVLFILAIFAKIYLMYLVRKASCYAAEKVWDAGAAFFSWFGGGSAPTMEEGEPNTHNYFRFNMPKPPPKAESNIPKFNFGKPQASSQCRSQLYNTYLKNAVLVHVTWHEDNDFRVQDGRCLMLCGRKMLVLKHYVEEWSAIAARGIKFNCALIHQNNKTGTACTIRIPGECLFENVAWACEGNGQFYSSNYGVVELPKQVPMFKNIVPMFATHAQHSNVAGKVDIYTLASQCWFDQPLGINNTFAIASTKNSSRVELQRAYRYPKQSKGMCGSVIVSPNLGSGNGAIIGMHCAGNGSSGYGYAEPLYFEMFSDFLKQYPARDIVEIPVVEIDKSPQELAEAAAVKEVVDNIKLNTNLMVFGKVPEEFKKRESGKTQIMPSLIAGMVYPVLREVNPLRPNDKRQPPGSHPLYDGCNKHGSGEVYPFDLEDVKEAKENLSEYLNQVMVPIRAEVKPLTLQQSVCGDCDIPEFVALNWNASEGFPLSTHRPKKCHDKKWLFTLEGDVNNLKLIKIHPMLQEQLDMRDQCFKLNLKPPTIYIDCLKDYLLPPEKCKIPGKTRIFSIAPIQCTIDCKMYLNDFCGSMKSTFIQNSIGIGINKDSMAWSDLVSYLLEVGDKIVTLDYKNFGPTLMSQLVVAANEIVYDWHKCHGASEDHLKRVEWILDCDILNPVHLCEDIVYQTVNGIASGSPITSEMNSIPNLLYIRIVYLKIMKKAFPHYASMYYFCAFVRIVVYGDDLIMSIADAIISHFNAVTIKDALFEHGIQVTGANKDSELYPYETIFTATFLKSNFALHPFRAGVWLAPVEMRSVTDALNWMHDASDLKEATLEVCRASLELAFGHGPEFYEQHRAKIIKACLSIGIVFFSKTWLERDREIFGDFDAVDLRKPLGKGLTWDYSLGDLYLD